MRFAALALMALLASAACSLTPSGHDECSSDSQCGDDVCARSGECLARPSLRTVAVKWTINGAPASTSACAAHPELYVQFDGTDYGDTLRFAPVACRDGVYIVDRLPKRYAQVEIGIEGGTGNVQPIDVATSQVALDLFH
jgi:hypothetical protein